MSDNNETHTELPAMPSEVVGVFMNFRSGKFVAISQNVAALLTVAFFIYHASVLICRVLREELRHD
jgi:hypothetical protein